MEKEPLWLGLIENCNIELNEPMSRHTSFKIGGNADYYICARDEEGLLSAVNACRQNNVPITILGNGSNMLVSDNGIRGAVITIEGTGDNIFLAEPNVIECGAGVLLSNVCGFALQNSLSGLEFAYGIPGSVGGAVFMNAGAYGGEIKDVLQSVRYLNCEGEFVTMPAEEAELSYRHSAFSHNGGIITSARFALTKGEPEAIKEKMNELMGRRKDKQPLEYPSAGSVFKRPQGAFAGTLIEQCGLKGFSIGGACVSEKHAGFIINKGGATCEDVLRLVEHIQKTVYTQTGYSLECEIRKIGV